MPLTVGVFEDFPWTSPARAIVGGRCEDSPVLIGSPAPDEGNRPVTPKATPSNLPTTRGNCTSNRALG